MVEKRVVEKRTKTGTATYYCTSVHRPFRMKSEVATWPCPYHLQQLVAVPIYSPFIPPDLQDHSCRFSILPEASIAH